MKGDVAYFLNRFVNRWIVGCGLLLILQACALKAVNEQRDTRSADLAYGKVAHNRVETFFGFYQHDVLQGYVQRVGEQLALFSQRNDLIYRFSVIDSPEILLFSLPGGYVYVSRGLLILLNNEAQLAALLAHELGHIAAGHVSNKFRENIDAPPVLGEELGYYDSRSEIIGLFSTIAEVNEHGYGWYEELEAYRFAAHYLVKANYEPSAILELYDVFSRTFSQDRFFIQSRRLHETAEYVRDLRERLAKVVEDMSSSKVESSDVIKRDERFLGRLSGVAVSLSSKMGHNTDRQSIHPGMALEVTMPVDWFTTQTPNMILAYQQSLQNDLVSYVKVTRANEIQPRDIVSKLKRLYVQSTTPVFQAQTYDESAQAAWFVEERPTVFGTKMVFIGLVGLDSENVFLIEASAKDRQLWEDYYSRFQALMKSMKLWVPAKDNEGSQENTPVELTLLVVSEDSTLETLLSNNSDYAWLRFLNQLKEAEGLARGQYIKVTKSSR